MLLLYRCTGRSRNDILYTRIDSAWRYIGSSAARSLPGRDVVRIVVGMTAGVARLKGHCPAVGYARTINDNTIIIYTSYY